MDERLPTKPQNSLVFDAVRFEFSALVLNLATHQPHQPALSKQFGFRCSPFRILCASFKSCHKPATPTCWDSKTARPSFFSLTPGWQGLKDKNKRGVGGLRCNGAAWETGCHFWPRDSLNVIINQPTLYFFQAIPRARVVRRGRGEVAKGRSVQARGMAWKK